MKCWRDLNQACVVDDCPMWMNDTATPGMPVGGLFNSDQGMCALAANAKLDVIHNILRMAECMDEDLLFDDDEFPEAVFEPLAKKERIPPQAGKKRKPKA